MDADDDTDDTDERLEICERDLALLPLIMRPRFVISTSPTMNAPPTQTTTVHTFSDVLPGGFEGRYWVLQELRGCRAANVSLVAQVLLQECKTGEGHFLYRYLTGTATNEGFLVESQAGPIPCYWPLPRGWNGTLSFLLVADSGAITMPFRWVSTLTEVTRKEWLAMWGR